MNYSYDEHAIATGRLLVLVAQARLKELNDCADWLAACIRPILAAIIDLMTPFADTPAPPVIFGHISDLGRAAEELLGRREALNALTVPIGA